MGKKGATGREMEEWEGETRDGSGGRVRGRKGKGEGVSEGRDDRERGEGSTLYLSRGPRSSSL